MQKARFTDEQIVAALRDAEATSANEAPRKHSVLKQSMHRWRKKFAGMEASNVHELKRLQDENAGLKKLLAGALRAGMRKREITLANIDLDKPWQNGSNERFHGTFRRECRNAEIFASFTETRVVNAQWHRRYNERPPHSSQNYITPEMAHLRLTEMRKA